MESILIIVISVTQGHEFSATKRISAKPQYLLFRGKGSKISRVVTCMIYQATVSETKKQKRWLGRTRFLTFLEAQQYQTTSPFPFGVEPHNRFLDNYRKSNTDDMEVLPSVVTDTPVQTTRVNNVHHPGSNFTDHPTHSIITFGRPVKSSIYYFLDNIDPISCTNRKLICECSEKLYGMRVFVAANLYNSEKILPSWANENSERGIEQFGLPLPIFAFGLKQVIIKPHLPVVIYIARFFF